MTEITTAAELDALALIINAHCPQMRPNSEGTHVLVGCLCGHETADFGEHFRHTADAILSAGYRPDRPSDSALREGVAALSKVRLHDAWRGSQRDDTPHPGYSWDEARAVRFLAALGIEVSE